MMKILYILFLILISSSWAYSQASFVHDKRAMGQVGKNSASIIAKETAVKESVSKARKAQEVISKYTAIIQLNVDRIHKSQQDISAFKEGTANIKVLNCCLVACFEELGGLAEDLPKYPLGTLAYSKRIKQITEHIIGIGLNLAETVTDGQVELHGIKFRSKVHNLIDPAKRLEIINRCIFDLRRVHSYIRTIRIEIQMRNTLRNAALGLAPTAVVSADMMKQIRQDVTRLWYN